MWNPYANVHCASHLSNHHFTSRKEAPSMNKFNYSSIYAPYFKQFVAMKQGLGYVSLRTEWVFFEFDEFFIDNNVTTVGITRQQVEQWRATRINDAPSTICAKYSILSQFCKYMCKVGYDCYIPRIPVNTGSNSFTPHIFSNREIADIFQACDNISEKARMAKNVLPQYLMPWKRC